MLKFTAETIKPVLSEINEHHCALLLVKDQGVYVMSANRSPQQYFRPAF